MLILVGAILMTVLGICADIILYQFFMQISKTAGFIYAGFGIFSLLFCLAFLVIYGFNFIYFHDLRWGVFGFLLLNVPKIIFLLFWLLIIVPFPGSLGENRIRTFICLGVDFLLVGLIIYGGLVGRTKLTVKRVSIESDRLPQSLDGLKLLHFSDFHLGSFGKKTRFVNRVVNRINSFEPDIIFFTGDLVNDRSVEVNPFIEIISRIESPNGVYSVLGNHDYGDYYDWDEDWEKSANMRRMRDIQRNWRWILLDNEHRIIEINGEQLAIIGVENWGDPPFQQYGNLQEAYEGVDRNLFSILLTHNPIHWTEEVLPQTNIDLSLSGHTHAFQLRFGNISPAALRYAKWAGLYREGNQFLYVNQGVGNTFYPMRIGALPELTLIELKAKQ